MASKRTPDPDGTAEDPCCSETDNACTNRMPLRGGRSRKVTDNVHVLLQQSPEPNLIIRHGRFIECNRAALQLLGLRAKQQLVGIQPSDCSPLRQADGRLSSEKADEILSSALRAGSYRFEWRHMRKDASIAPVQVTLTRLNVDGGKALYTSWQDLTAQESLMSAVRESETLFREGFEQSEDAVILLDPVTWRIVDANPSAVRLYGYPKRSLLKGGIQLFMRDGECERFKEAIRCGATRSVRVDEACHVTHNGKKLFIKTKCRPISFHSRALLYCRFRDVTDKMRLQKEALFIENKLIHANRLTSLGTLVSSVAHEINNPNNFIMLNSSLLHEAWIDVARILEDYTRERGDVNLAGVPFVEMKGAISKLISGVMEGSRRINSIVDSLKGFSQRSQESSKGPVNVNKVIQMAASILSSHIKKYTNGFNLSLDETIPDMLGNGQQLEQVVINLVMNALQALPNKECGVRVVSRFDNEKRMIVIRIEDEGNGIPADLLVRIKEPFFSTKIDSGGTGLGVYISQSIIKGHNGTLVFESSEGRGTTAIVSLPILTE